MNASAVYPLCLEMIFDTGYRVIQRNQKEGKSRIDTNTLLGSVYPVRREKVFSWGLLQILLSSQTVPGIFLGAISGELDLMFHLVSRFLTNRLCS
jgi:hypothetical protein